MRTTIADAKAKETETEPAPPIVQKDKEIEAPKSEIKEDKDEKTIAPDTPSASMTLEQKIEALAKATQPITDEFAKETFGNNIPLTGGWAKRSTFIQRLKMAFSKLNHYAKLALSDNLGDKIFATKYIEKILEYAKAFEACNKLYNSMAEPLQRLMNEIPKDHWDTKQCPCVCSRGKQAWRECTAHVYQVPEGIKPTMPNGIIELHIISAMIVLSIRNFLFCLNRPDTEEDELTREDYNAMKSSDETANWHGAALDEFGGEGKVISYAAAFDEAVRLHHYLAGDSKMPSASDQIKAAFEYAIAEKRDFVEKRKYESAKKASTRAPVQHRQISLGF
jgi:hypothetical protein